MLTLLLIFIPILSAALLFLFPQSLVKSFSVCASFVSLAITGIALAQFDTSGSYQFVIDLPWIDMLGIHFHIGMDGVSLVMILLSNLLMPFILLSAEKNTYHNNRLFFAFMLIMQGAMNGVFVSLDMFLYYIFWELALVPGYFLVLWWGSGDARKITFKFFIYTLFGSLFMLVAIIWISWQNATPSSDIDEVYNLQISDQTQLYIFLAFALAYAIKIPIFPFHTWQPDTYTSAPTPVTMLLSGIMLKMGLYSIIRWVIPVVPFAVHEYGNYLMVIASLGIFYVSAIAWVQKDLKRLFAYSSIAHVGLIAAGLFTATQIGLQGGLLQMLAHGVNVVGLFYIAQILFRKFGDNQIDGLGGIRLQAPLFAGLYLVILLGSVALPLTNSFPGEFMLLSSIFNVNGWLCLLAGSGVILGAVYMLSSYKSVVLGDLNSKTNSFTELNGNDKMVLIPIVILIFVFGLFPNLINNLTEHSVIEILNQYQSQITDTAIN